MLFRKGCMTGVVEESTTTKVSKGLQCTWVFYRTSPGGCIGIIGLESSMKLGCGFCREFSVSRGPS